jgi:hypothetical protein
MTLIYVGHFESALPASLEKRILLDKGQVKALETISERNLIVQEENHSTLVEQ